MISFSRYGLSILLMLLQIASPLIHAHKNGIDLGGVFHLPEFEQINRFLDQNTSAFVATTENGEIVTIDSGIKTKPKILNNEPLNIFILILFFITVTQNSLRKLFDKIEPQTHFRFFNLSAPRAPPVFLFRSILFFTNFKIYQELFMKKKIITASVLGLIAFNTTPVSATESIAKSLGVYPTCTGCHTNANLITAYQGNLKAAAKTAYNQDKRNLSGLKTFLAASTTPTLTCTLPQVLNTAKDSCITPPPPTCIAPKILNTAQTACINPPPPTCLDTEVLKNNVCIAKPIVPTCLDTEMLKNNVCVVKPTTTVKNTKPVLNSVAQQWDAQVGELLSIPLSVNDAEQDDFTILTSKLVGSTLSEVHPDAAGLPSIDFEWTPTLANVNKIQSITFQAKETATAKKYTSNIVSVKVRVWSAGDRDTASIMKLNVMTSKFTAGNLKLAGNVKFNALLTTAERQAFIDQTLTLNVSDVNGSIYSEPLMLTKNGAWAITIPIKSVSCDITLEFAGQNASRKVVGCSQTVAVSGGNYFNHDDDDHDDNKEKSHTKNNG